MLHRPPKTSTHQHCPPAPALPPAPRPGAPTHLWVVALLLQLRHRLHDHVAHAAVAEDGDVCALAHHLGALQALAVVAGVHLTCNNWQEREEGGRQEGEMRERQRAQPWRGARGTTACLPAWLAAWLMATGKAGATGRIALCCQRQTQRRAVLAPMSPAHKPFTAQHSGAGSGAAGTAPAAAPPPEAAVQQRRRWGSMAHPPLTLYSSTCSKKMIGLSLRMALFSRALLLATVDTATSCTPAQRQRGRRETERGE